MNTRNENQAEERQPLQIRWYCLSANGMATLALDENDARNVALESDQLYPRNGPHQAVQMVPVQPDGRGTDAQILKERDIARCAIVGALAAGHAGQPHPGADHWLAAAHDAGVTIASLERADRPVGGWQGDAFQSMEHPFSPHTGDAAEAAMADLDKACCKPLPNAASAALDSMMGRSEWPAFTAGRSDPGAEVDSMGIPTSCGKPLCSPDEHHPLCSLYQPVERPATQVVDKRAAFEAWLRTKPEARLWNTTDAMFSAYQAGRAALHAPQQPTPLPFDIVVDDSVPPGQIVVNQDGKEAGRIVNVDAQQATPEPVQPFLVRDVAALLGASVPDVCKELVHLGHGQRSTNMEIKPEEALAVAEHIRAKAATPEPVVWKPIKTSAGGREAVRNFFRSTLKRHDFDDYITGALAADFACVLGGYLQATRPAPGVPDGLPAVLTDWGFDVHDDEEGRTWLTIRNDQDDVARLSVPTFWPASGRQTINAVVLHQFSAALTSALAAAQAKGVQS